MSDAKLLRLIDFLSSSTYNRVVIDRRTLLAVCRQLLTAESRAIQLEFDHIKGRQCDKVQNTK